MVDETVTYLEIDGEAKKELGRTSLFNRNCRKCTTPEVYEDYKNLDGEANIGIGRCRVQVISA